MAFFDLAAITIWKIAKPEFAQAVDDQGKR
jgi:hypothetical protein